MVALDMMGMVIKYKKVHIELNSYNSFNIICAISYHTVHAGVGHVEPMFYTW